MMRNSEKKIGAFLLQILLLTAELALTTYGLKTKCDVRILKHLDSCTDSFGITLNGDGYPAEVAKGTICSHEVCGILRLAECTIGGRWVDQEGKELRESNKEECETEGYVFKPEQSPKVRKKRGWFRRRSPPPPPPPPPPPDCGHPGNVANAYLHITKTTEGGVVTYTCNAGYAHTAGSMSRTCQSNRLWTGTKPTCSYMNSCSSNPCYNGGICSNIPNSYTCKCPANWKGSRCETDVDECSSATLNKCNQNCRNTNGGYVCSCITGYSLLADKHTCQDIDECVQGVAECEHTCTNTKGSFQCSCRTGFELSSDEKSCQDVDECLNGTAKCEHNCTNTNGSYSCSCYSGYQLSINGISCTDTDECTDGTADCKVYCNNTAGSYYCSCPPGFVLDSDGRSCIDFDECSSLNETCEQICLNEPGTFTCKCQSGYTLTADRRTCLDIDECARDLDGCSQNCQNTAGSFNCTCRTGYELKDDRKTCTDIDDCDGVICQHGGICRDGLNSYSCSCAVGYTSAHCEKDVNECELHNGGCQDICLNTDGSYSCSCFEGRQIQEDRHSCSGGNSSTVFERFKISGRRLPKACFVLPFPKCTDGENIGTKLTSTSEWYKLTMDKTLAFTFGIVFVKVNDLALPLSLKGLEVRISPGELQINYGTKFTSGEGSIIINDETPAECKSFELVESDIFEFISAGSFLTTYLLNLFPALPNWIKFEKSRDSFLAVQDLRSDLVYGRNMEKMTWCEGAPVLDDHLYSVFRFGSTFSLEVLGENIKIPKLIAGHKFCFIIDICHSNGGSIFFMVPEESRGMFESINVFKQLKLKDQMTILPRGFGISLVNGINVKHGTTDIELWNGDAMFNYPVFPSGNLWIGADAEKNDKKLMSKGSADIFIDIPNIETVLTSIFLDEWNGFIRLKVSTSPILKFRIFGKDHAVSFRNLVTTEMNLYLSVGGSHREWCGEKSNPPGFFFSFRLEINPFKGIPILEDWGIANVHKAYGFATYEPPQNVVDINIKEDILNFNQTLIRVNDLFAYQLQKLDIMFENVTLSLREDIMESIGMMKHLLNNILEDLFSGKWKGKKQILEQLWQKFHEMKDRVELFFDETEFLADETLKNLNYIIKSEVDALKNNLKNALEKVTNSLIMSSSDSGFTGIGLKYTTFLQFLGLNIGEFDIEVIFSSEHLFKCSRFEHVKKHFEGEKALRFLGRASYRTDLGVFLTYIKGAGIGGALSADKEKFAIQAEIFTEFLGLKATADVFITNKGLYFYLEGNIWDIFLAQMEVSSEIKSNWYQFVYKVKGRFVAKSRKRRNIQTVSSSFQDSYLDALKRVINTISDVVKKRISLAQDGLSAAQASVSKAQRWIDEKKDDVKRANEKFDSAVAALGRTKDKLDSAKEPFEEALRKLESAQRKVDNLCRLKTCRYICIPGVKCKICRTGGWVKVPYPCCRFTSCMIKVPNPICVAANLACRVVRAAAFLLLEGAKIFVRAPMIAFDAAKAAVSVAQVVVDKSRIVLDVAIGVLNLAKLNLQYVNGVLESAKIVLEGVKLAIGAAVKVLELVIDVGLKNIIDVKNCGFEIELSTHNLAVFDVFCDVNAFKLGWKTIRIRINFKNIIQSLWNAARATIDTLMKLLGIHRKRREVEFQVSAKVHKLLRHIRESEKIQNIGRYENDSISLAGDILVFANFSDTYNNNSNLFSNESVDITHDIIGFANDTDSDYDNRVLIFKEKCASTSLIMKFLGDAFESLQDTVNQSKLYMDEMISLNDTLDQMTVESLSDNITLENAGISREYAEQDYNMTEEDLDKAMNESKTAILNDPLILEINSSTTLAKENLNAEMESLESINFIEIWLSEMSNVSTDYFNTSECNGFKDCVLYAISTLFSVYEAEDVPDIDNIKKTILDLESVLLELFQNESSMINEAALALDSIIMNVTYLNDTNVFCSDAPVFISEPTNQTILELESVVFTCNASGDPIPTVQWFKNDNMIVNETLTIFMIANASVNDSGIYTCRVGNVVANITSRQSYLTVISYDEQVCEKDNGRCQQLCENVFGSRVCKCYIGFQLNNDNTTCSDFNECLAGLSDCELSCLNTEGSYTCNCKDGYLLDENGHSCKLQENIKGPDSLNGLSIVWIVLACVLVVLVISVIVFLVCKRFRKHHPKNEETELDTVKPFSYGPITDHDLRLPKGKQTDTVDADGTEVTVNGKQNKDVPEESFSYNRMPEESDETTEPENSTSTPPQSSDNLQDGYNDGPLTVKEDSSKHEND